MWLHSLKVAQLLRSAACLRTNQSRSYLNHLVLVERTVRCTKFESEVAGVIRFDRVISLDDLLAVDAFIALVLPGTPPMEFRDFTKFHLPRLLIVQWPDRTRAASFQIHSCSSVSHPSVSAVES